MSPSPKASAKPTAQYMRAAIEKFVRILATTVPTFLPRENPISRNAKPVCMNITSRAATITQIELMATLSGSTPASAASSVSAEATAGRSNASAPAQASPPVKRFNVIRPPRSGITSESLRVTGAGVFGPVSKLRRSMLRPSSGGLPRGERKVRNFVHMDTVRSRGRN